MVAEIVSQLLLLLYCSPPTLTIQHHTPYTTIGFTISASGDSIKSTQQPDSLARYCSTHLRSSSSHRRERQRYRPRTSCPAQLQIQPRRFDDQEACEWIHNVAYPLSSIPSSRLDDRLTSHRQHVRTFYLWRPSAIFIYAGGRYLPFTNRLFIYARSRYFV